jgi:maltokinase
MFGESAIPPHPTTSRGGVPGAVASWLPLSIPEDGLRTYEIRRRSVKPHVRALTRLEHALRGLDLEELAGRRWFAGKERRPTSVGLVDAFELSAPDDAWLVIADFEHDDGAHDRYLLPARVERSVLVEPAPDDPYWAALVELVGGGGERSGLTGSLVATPGPSPATSGGTGRQLSDDQSNTSVVIGERLVVKSYRRILRGVHPEPELLAALAGIGSRRAPGFAGLLTRRSADGEEALACLYAFVPGEPVGWEPLIERVRGALASHDDGALADAAESAAALGRASAELHVDLASALGVELAVEEDAVHLLEGGRRRLREATRVASGEAGRALGLLAESLDRELADLALLEGSPIARTHGDLHVGQFVSTPRGPVVVDFEGEPGLELEARRRKGSPLRDLACLLLSLDHVAVAAARRVPRETTIERAFAWSARARELATAAYREGVEGSPLELDERLLQAFEIEKELHEVIYAATVLPEWSYAPALVLPRLVAADGLSG